MQYPTEYNSILSNRNSKTHQLPGRLQGKLGRKPD